MILVKSGRQDLETMATVDCTQAIIDRKVGMFSANWPGECWAADSAPNSATPRCCMPAASSRMPPTGRKLWQLRMAISPSFARYLNIFPLPIMVYLMSSSHSLVSSSPPMTPTFFWKPLNWRRLRFKESTWIWAARKWSRAGAIMAPFCRTIGIWCINWVRDRSLPCDRSCCVSFREYPSTRYSV